MDCTGVRFLPQRNWKAFTFEGETTHKMALSARPGWRTSAPKTIAGYEVAEVVDYDADVPGTGLPCADVLVTAWSPVLLMVRPSGTEPKIKAYLSAVVNSEGAAGCHQSPPWQMRWRLMKRRGSKRNLPCRRGDGESPPAVDSASTPQIHGGRFFIL